MLQDHRSHDPTLQADKVLYVTIPYYKIWVSGCSAAWPSFRSLFSFEVHDFRIGTSVFYLLVPVIQDHVHGAPKTT